VEGRRAKRPQGRRIFSGRIISDKPMLKPKIVIANTPAPLGDPATCDIKVGGGVDTFRVERGSMLERVNIWAKHPLPNHSREMGRRFC